MARLVICALILLAPIVHAATTTDPAGDVSDRAFGEPVDQPAVDLIEVRGAFVDEVLDLAIEVNGELPLHADADPDRRFTYFFMVGRGENATISQQRDLAVLCFFHQGQLDLQCEITEGDGAMRRASALDRNVSIGVRVPWEGALTVGAFAHESLPNGTRRDIVAQDFTDNAAPYGSGPEREPDMAPSASPTPWWRTPWIFVALLAALAILVWLKNRR